MIPSLKPVERPRALGDRVYEALRDTLLNGSHAVGAPLQVTQLAERLGVSRTPVREALTRLAGEGVVAWDGRAFMLPLLGLDDIDELYEVRLLVEPAAIRRAAVSASCAGAIREIADARARAEAADADGDVEAFREANRRFRSGWLALVPNRLLVKVVEQYADHTQQIRALTFGRAEIRKTVLDGLAHLAAAFETGDGEAAAAAMREHLTQSKRALVSTIAAASRGARRQGTRGGKRS